MIKREEMDTRFDSEIDWPHLNRFFKSSELQNGMLWNSDLDPAIGDLGSVIRDSGPLMRDSNPATQSSDAAIRDLGLVIRFPSQLSKNRVREQKNR